MLTKIVPYMAIIFGTAMSISWFFQTKIMFKNQSAKNISKTFILVAWFSILFFMIQGFLTQDLVLIIPFVVGFGGINTTLFAYFKFRK